MCGIAGWIDWEHDITKQQSRLEALVSPLTCRGPDGSGTWVTPRAGLGHRRLVVIDPEGGMQPMSRREGNRRYTVVYNGELYNFQELKQELVSKGYQFRSRSDTEVLLTSYIEWGPDCVSRFNGIYAFAIWGDHDHTLFLARDPLGVKPLFYAPIRSGLVFGSEPKSVLAHPAVSRAVGPDGLAEILALGPARTPGHGVFRDLRELGPGHYLLYGPRQLQETRYWSLVSAPHTDDVDTTANTVRDLLRASVTRQLVADVPIATLLSGGLDSSAVTAFAADERRRTGKEPVHTFSIDFVDMERYFRPDRFQTNLDAPWVTKVSTFLGTNHHRLVLDTPELAEALPDALRARDFPGMADVDTSLLLFSREIRQYATVGLSGEAADEIFGGYPWFHQPEALAATTFPWARAFDLRLRVLSPEAIQYMHAEEYVRDRYQQALHEVPRLAGESPADARIREIAYLSITRFLPTLLDRKDRMTMATGLEVRVPFCDYQLVEYVWNIPWAMKNHFGTAKGILRKALTGLLPDDVIMRQKSPYPSTPHPSYFAAMKEGLAAILADPAAPLQALVNAPQLRQLMDSGPDPNRPLPWFGQLMGTAQMFAYLIQVNAWLKDYAVELVP